jgi:branched-chain amino acid transport system substrate-binding protein
MPTDTPLFLQRISLVLALLVCAFLTGCAQPKAATGDPIVLGGYMPLTGSLSSWGVSADQGVRLAIDAANANGGIRGRPVKFINYDTHAEADMAVEAITKLIDQDHAVAIIGELTSSMCLAGGPIAQKKGVPMITPFATNAKVTQIGDMIFRVCYIDPFQGAVNARYAYVNLHARRAAVFGDNTQASATGLRDAFIGAFEHMGGKIVIKQSFASGDSDFTTQLSAIRDAKPDVLFLPGNYAEVAHIALAIKKMGITTPVLGGDGWDSPELVTIAGDALEGWTYSNHFSPEDPHAQRAAFSKRYLKAYGTPADTLACLGYDAAEVMIGALRRSKSLDGEDIAAAISATRNYPGVTGHISINAERNADKPLVMLRYHKGVWHYVTTVDPFKQ